MRAPGPRPQAASRKPQAASRKPQATEVSVPGYPVLRVHLKGGVRNKTRVKWLTQMRQKGLPNYIASLEPATVYTRVLCIRNQVRKTTPCYEAKSHSTALCRPMYLIMTLLFGNTVALHNSVAWSIFGLICFPLNVPLSPGNRHETRFNHVLN